MPTENITWAASAVIEQVNNNACFAFAKATKEIGALTAPLEQVAREVDEL